MSVHLVPYFNYLCWWFGFGFEFECSFSYFSDFVCSGFSTVSDFIFQLTFLPLQLDLHFLFLIYFFNYFPQLLADTPVFLLDNISLSICAFSLSLSPSVHSLFLSLSLSMYSPSTLFFSHSLSIHSISLSISFSASLSLSILLSFSYFLPHFISTSPPLCLSLSVFFGSLSPLLSFPLSLPPSLSPLSLSLSLSFFLSFYLFFFISLPNCISPRPNDFFIPVTLSISLPFNLFS